MKTEISFTSGGVTCAAWHVPATTDRLRDSWSLRPCVVMGAGFGGTRDTGLPAYADAFAQVGIDAFVFDYRGFGDSAGAPRQDVSARRQRTDYRAAVAAARRLPDIDPKRIALWGTSASGGHVIAVAARDRHIAAVVAITPATDGPAVLRHALLQFGPVQLLRLLGHGIWDLIGTPLTRTPHCVPVVGPPGSTAFLTVPGAEEVYTSIAGPTWRNEVRARAALQIGLARPGHFADRLVCPVLIQVGTRDRVAPPAAARRAAAKAGARAELREYPVDHFHVYNGRGQQQVLADQITFLLRVLAPAPPSTRVPDS